MAILFYSLLIFFVCLFWLFGDFGDPHEQHIFFFFSFFLFPGITSYFGFLTLFFQPFSSSLSPLPHFCPSTLGCVDLPNRCSYIIPSQRSGSPGFKHRLPSFLFLCFGSSLDVKACCLSRLFPLLVYVVYTLHFRLSFSYRAHLLLSEYVLKCDVCTILVLSISTAYMDETLLIQISYFLFPFSKISFSCSID